MIGGFFARLLGHRRFIARRRRGRGGLRRRLNRVFARRHDGLRHGAGGHHGRRRGIDGYRGPRGNQLDGVGPSTLQPLEPAVHAAAFFPPPRVMDLGDEPRVRLWEGEAYEHIFIDGARVYPTFPPASPRTDARRRFMTSIASSSRTRPAVDVDASAPRFGSPTCDPVFSMSAGASGFYMPKITRAERRLGLLRLHHRGCEHRCRASSLADSRDTAAFATDRRTSPARGPRPPTAQRASGPAIEQPRSTCRLVEPGRAETRERRRARNAAPWRILI